MTEIFTFSWTYWGFQLILEPSQVELQVRPGHELARPAGHLGDDAGRHVHDESGRPVQQGQQVNPDGFSSLGSVFLENFYARLVLLEKKIVRSTSHA